MRLSAIVGLFAVAAGTAAVMGTVGAPEAMSSTCPAGWTLNSGANSCSVTYGYSGTTVFTTIPIATSLTVSMVGGAGGTGGTDDGTGSYGSGSAGRVTGTVDIAQPGTSLTIAVGGNGGNATTSRAGQVTAPEATYGGAAGTNPLTGYT